MSNCPEEIIEYMNEALDEDIPPEHEEELKRHLQTCTECRKYFYELKKTITLVKGMSKVKAPANFTNNVMAHLPREKKKVGFKRWLKHHPFMVAASVFLVLMMTSFIASWNQDDNFSVTKQENIIIENNTAVVPEGETIHGDIVVKNGDIRIDGKVEGNVTVINGEKYMASAGEVTGDIEEINQAFEWLWYQIKNTAQQLMNTIKGNS